jgi:hypothetical protein
LRLSAASLPRELQKRRPQRLPSYS